MSHTILPLNKTLECLNILYSRCPPWGSLNLASPFLRIFKNTLLSSLHTSIPHLCKNDLNFTWNTYSIKSMKEEWNLFNCFEVIYFQIKIILNVATENEIRVNRKIWILKFIFCVYIGWRQLKCKVIK